MKHKVTYTIKGFVPSFTDTVTTVNGTHEEIVDQLNEIVSETIHDERTVVREVLLVVDVS